MKHALAAAVVFVSTLAAQESAPQPQLLKLEYSATGGPVVSMSNGGLTVRDFQLGGEPIRWPADVAYEDVPRKPTHPATGRRVRATAIDATGKPRGISVLAQANLLEIELNGLEPGAPYFLRAKIDAGPSAIRMRSFMSTSFAPPILTTALGDPDADGDMLLDLSRDRLMRALPVGTGLMTRAGADGARWIEWRGVAPAVGAASLLQMEVYYDAMRKRLNLPPGAFRQMHFDRPVSGWQSRHALGAEVSEETLLKEAGRVSALLQPYGLEVFEIDDGWQSGAPDARAWTPEARRFPRGFAGFNESLKALGLRPGVWWIPQAAAVDDAKSKGLLLDAEGAAVDDGAVHSKLWSGADPEGLARIGASAAALVREGFEHFAMDAQPAVLNAYRDVDGDAPGHLSASRAYRASVGAVRDALGPTRFLASGWGGDFAPGSRTPVDAVGLVDSLRAGREVEALRRGFLNAADAVGMGGQANGVAWWSDPGAVLVGGALTLDEARAWASLVSLSGQMLFASERIGELPEPRLEVLRRAFPALPIREMRWSDRIERPRIVRLWKEVEGQTSLATGYFAYDPREDAFAPAGDSRLPDEMLSAEKFEFWSGRFIGRAPIERADVPLFVEPGTCAIVASRAARPHPFVLSTSRHVSQGFEVSRERFDAETSTLSGVSAVVAQDPYEIRVVAPSRAWTASAASTDGPACTLEPEGRLTRVRFTAPKSGPVAWRVRFAKADAPPASKPAGEIRVRAETGGEPSVRLAWTEVPRAAGAFLVKRWGKTLATTVSPAFTDFAVQFNQEYDYEITPIDDEGRLGAPASIKVASRQPPRVKISGLEHTVRPAPDVICRADENASGGPITLAGQKHGAGFGLRGPARVDIPLKGLRGRLTALFGIDDSAGDKGSASLRVLIDGHELVKTPVARGGEKPLEVRADIFEGATLTIELDDAGDGVELDIADLASAVIRPFRS